MKIIEELHPTSHQEIGGDTRSLRSCEQKTNLQPLSDSQEIMNDHCHIISTILQFICSNYRYSAMIILYGVSFFFNNYCGTIIIIIISEKVTDWFSEAASVNLY